MVGKMLSWALTFFLIALVAAFLGFGGLAGTSMEIGRMLLGLFVVVLLISVISGRVAWFS